MNNNNNVTKLVQRGQIWYANLNGIGSVQNSIRPVVIVSNRMNNAYAPILCVVPLTAQVKKMLPTHVKLNQSTGLNKDSIALCEQILTIDKSQLGEYIGIQLNDYYMNQINNSMMIQLGIEDNYKNKQLNIM